MKKETTRIFEKLSDIEKEKGELPLLLEFYSKLVQLQDKTRKRISKPKPDVIRESIYRQAQAVQPLLDINDFSPNHRLVQKLFIEVVSLFASYPRLFGKLPEKLLEPGMERLLTLKSIKEWLGGMGLPEKLGNGTSVNLVSAMLQATLQPFLAYYSENLKDSVDEMNWRRSCCPICGGIPDFSYLGGQYGARYLVCSRCNTEWLFNRLECPFCGCQEQSALNYLTDDKELYRLYTCNRCKKYIKAVDIRKTKEKIIFPLERLLTIDMDRQAREMGFKTP